MILSNREEGCGLANQAGPFLFWIARMPELITKEETAPKSCRECEHWHEIKQKLRISELLTQAMNGIEERMKAKDFKPTVGDYLKLLQLEKELEDEGPKEIRVTWVDPAVTSEPSK